MTEVKRNPINIQLLLILVLAIFLVIFTLQNPDSVSIKLFLWTVSIPKVLLILVCLLAGYLLPHFSYIPKIWKLKSELTRTRKEKEALEEGQVLKTKEKPHPEGIAFDDLDGGDDDEPDESAGAHGFFRG